MISKDGFPYNNVWVKEKSVISNNLQSMFLVMLRREDPSTLYMGQRSMKYVVDSTSAPLLHHGFSALTLFLNALFPETFGNVCTTTVNKHVPRNTFWVLAICKTCQFASFMEIKTVNSFLFRVTAVHYLVHNIFCACPTTFKKMFVWCGW